MNVSDIITYIMKIIKVRVVSEIYNRALKVKIYRIKMHLNR